MPQEILRYMPEDFGEVEAVAAVEVGRAVIGHEADVGGLRRVGVEIVHDRLHDEVADDFL